MKTRGILILLLAAALTFGIVGCAPKIEDLGYDGEWYSDEQYHWRDPDENGDIWKSEHHFVDGVCPLCGYKQKSKPNDPDYPDDDDPTLDPDDPNYVPPEPDYNPNNPGEGVGGDYQEGTTIVDGFSYTVLYSDDSICYSIGVGTYTNESNIVIPSTYNDAPVIAIDDNGFYNDKALVSITLPDTIRTIGFEAFAGCTSLRSFDMPDSVTTMYHRAFFDCKSLSEIKLSKNLKIINSKTFTNCISLKKIELPEGFEKVENDGFTDCIGLQEVYIPKSLKLLNYTAFINCPNIVKVVAYDLESWLSITYRHVTSNPCFYGAKLYFNSTGSEVLVTDVVIPEGTKKIKLAAFTGCSSITTVTVPDSVTEIGTQAFGGCKNIKTFKANGVTDLDNGVFSDMKALEEVWLEGAVNINNDVFLFDSALKKIHFGKGLKKLGQRSFGYTALTDIYYPGTVAEWKAISKTAPSNNKGNWWDIDTPSYTVHCANNETTHKLTYEEVWPGHEYK